MWTNCRFYDTGLKGCHASKCSGMQRRTYAQLAARILNGIRHLFSWNPSRIRHLFFSGIPGIPWNPRIVFLWNPRIPESRNPGIVGTWNHGIPESGNLGNPESRNPLAVFWIPCRITKLLSFGYQRKWSKVNFHHRNRIAILKVNFCCGNQYNTISYVGMFHKI